MDCLQATENAPGDFSAADRTLISAAWQSGQVSSETAWDLFERNRLWGDKGNIIRLILAGSAAEEARFEIACESDRPFEKAASGLMAAAFCAPTISGPTLRWLSEQFGFNSCSQH